MNSNETLYLRLAEEDDVDLIYEWANEPEVRKNSFNSDPIPYENHLKWYRGMMDNKERNVQLILMKEATPVGQCRLRVEKGEAEIGCSIDKNYRGMGYGSLIFSTLNTWVTSNRKDIKCIIAKVKTNNYSSQKALINAGYKKRGVVSEEGQEYVELAYKL